MIFAMFMANFVMSLKPQVMTLIKHHVNLSLDNFAANISARLHEAVQRVDTITQTPVHNKAIRYNGHTVNAMFVKLAEITFCGDFNRTGD